MKIGLLIADDNEYEILHKKDGELKLKPFNFYTREGHCFNIDKDIEVMSVWSGVGKVNAAAAATWLVMNGCKAVFSFGLSGGISGICRHEFMVGTEYIEHDFDLTPLGYKPCEKPSQEYVYRADQRLISLFTERYPFVKKGVVVSGDCFICDDGKRKFLRDNFNAMSCDMESAAVASVCSLAGIPFITLRKISDNAGDDASESYTEARDIKGDEVLEILFGIMKETALFLE